MWAVSVFSTNHGYIHILYTSRCITVVTLHTVFAAWLSDIGGDGGEKGAELRFDIYKSETTG